jgi:hypothetical protein
MRNIRILLLALLMFHFSCSENDVVKKVSKDQDLIPSMISLEKSSSNHFSYTYTSDNYKELISLRGSTFLFEGEEFRIDILGNDEADNARISSGSAQIIISPLSLQDGHIVVQAIATEAMNNCATFNPNCSISWQDYENCHIETKSDIEFGPPSGYHSASVRVNGINGNILYGNALVLEYNGAPGDYTTIRQKCSNQLFSNCEDDKSRVRVTAQHFNFGSYIDARVLLDCDD